MRIIENLIYSVLYPIVAAGAIVYIIGYFSKAEQPSFELAVISTVIGGFALSSGFLDQASAELKRAVRRIGALYFGAAIAFTVLVLVVPMAKVETTGVTYWLVFLSNLISIFVAVLFFTLATASLVSKLPQLFRELWH